MTEEMQSKRVVVCLGSGRSGTSLIMQVLKGFGLSLSGDLVEAREHNPEGPQEDRAIAAAYDELLRSNGMARNLPLAEDLLSRESYEKCQKTLGNILKSNLAATNTLWGFKDPYTSNLLPAWRRIFNRQSVVPVYVLAVRNPAAVVTSYSDQFSEDPLVAELRWLYSTLEALENTGGNVFIVHYESWFGEERKSVASQLLAYTGLDKHFNADVDQVMAEIVSPKLNRSQWGKYEIKNRWVGKLYEALLGCSGADFDRTALMKVAAECSQAIDEFLGWSEIGQKMLLEQANTIASLGQQNENMVSQEIPRLKKNIRRLKSDHESVEEKESEIANLTKDMRHSTLENSRLLIQNKELANAIVEKEAVISSINSGHLGFSKKSQLESRKTVELPEELAIGRKTLAASAAAEERIRSSISYRAGNALVLGLKKPGRNTILLPYRLLKIFRSRNP